MNLYPNQTNVTDFSLNFLRFVMELTMSTFTGNFSNFSGHLYYYNAKSYIGQPSFFIYKLNEGNKLFIGTKGSTNINDATINMAINPIITNKGVFINGYYHAALYIYNYAYSFIKKHDGPIYFIGHSMGASVSTVLHCISSFDFFNAKDINTIAFAPAPAISENLNKSYGNKIITVINSEDIVPTISIPNIVNYLRKNVKIKIPWNFIKKIINFSLSLASCFSKTFNKKLVSSMKNALNDTINEIVNYSNNQTKNIIRYPPGTIFQFSLYNPSYINCSIIKPENKINILALTSNSIKLHDPIQYIKILDSTFGD